MAGTSTQETLKKYWYCFIVTELAISEFNKENLFLEPVYELKHIDYVPLMIMSPRGEPPDILRRTSKVSEQHVCAQMYSKVHLKHHEAAAARVLLDGNLKRSLTMFPV